MIDQRSRLELPALAAGLIMAAVVYAATLPHAGDLATPLAWDMSEHYLRSLDFSDSIRHASVTGFGGGLLRWSVYPPLNYALRGTWIAVWGESVTALGIFHFLTFVVALAGLWWGFRRSETSNDFVGFFVATAALLTLRDFVAYTHTVMLDSHASAWALLAVGSMPSLARAPSFRRAAITFLLVCAALFTKYNVGLPLLVSLGAMWLLTIRGHGRQSLWILGVAVAVVAAWALFLTLQDHGWESFRAFSTNRATEGQWTPSTRAAWYARQYVTQLSIHPVIAAAGLLLAFIGATRWRSPLLVAACTYILSTLFVIIHHEYLLPRLLIAPTVMLVIPIGIGARLLASWMPSAVGRRAIATVVLVAAGLLAIAPTRASVERILPPERALLDPVTRYVNNAFAMDEPFLVLGTFNNFSQPWVSLLWRRSVDADPAPPLQVELYYPFEASREQYDAKESPRYREILDEYLASSPARQILILEPLQGSRWWDRDYELWNRWKRNYIEAARQNPALRVIDDRVVEGAGIRVSVLTPVDTSQISYDDGWDPPEGWGRWIVEPEASFRVRPRPDQAQLVITAAPHPAQRGAQTCRIVADGVPLGSFVVDGPAWNWMEHVIDLPDRRETWNVAIRCSGSWTDSATDSRLVRLPVKNIYLR